MLTDLRMPGGEGTELIARLCERIPGLPVMVLSTFCSRADIAAVMSAGAVGYLLKDSGRQELFAAVRASPGP